MHNTVLNLLKISKEVKKKFESNTNLIKLFGIEQIGIRTSQTKNNNIIPNQAVAKGAFIPR